MNSSTRVRPCVPNFFVAMTDLGLVDVGWLGELDFFDDIDQVWKGPISAAAEISVETQSDSDVDHGANNRKRTKQACTVFPAARDQRQRGKNWERTEEEILVEAKGRDMDWKAISECLKSKGFIRDHRHCSDKWYALRKHYLDIQQWIAQNPHLNYWELADSERIRTVPSSFCQRWYQIFDAACQRPEVRRRAVCPNPRRRPDPSSSHHGLPGLDSSARSDHDFWPSTAVECANQVPFSDIGVLWAEIRELSHTLRQKFAAEEEERTRNMEIKEKKLQLKIERFKYKRQRDEDLMRRRPPGLMPSQRL